MEPAQFYQILAVVFAIIIPLIWNLVLRGKIDNHLDSMTLNPAFKRVNLFLGYMSYYHKIVSGILVGIGAIFAIVGILFS